MSNTKSISMAKILLVNRSPQNLAVALVRSGGHEPIEVLSFKHGLEVARDLPYDSIVVAEYKNSDGEAPEFMENLEKSGIHHRVIVHSDKCGYTEWNRVHRYKSFATYLQTAALDQTLLESIDLYLPGLRNRELLPGNLFQQHGEVADKIMCELGKVAPLDVNVTVSGESGLGKERIAKVVAENLTFLGIVAISDPVRSDVPFAVKEVIDAGIKVKIVTGDTPGTAKEIGRQIGLWNDATDGDRNIITGTEFAEFTDKQLKERVGDLKIIARARPMDKKRLVEALQANNEVVAVTGDGTNDAPALKTAHVGLSMGDGTSVAKEASDITIIDNSFSSIGRAVMWGRSLFQNIQRFILFQMTVNVAACFIVLFGAFMGMQSPLTVTQMLWVNLIMDTFAAMALASLPPAQSVMKEKPRSREAFIINNPMWKSIIGVGGVFFLLLLGLLYYFEHTDITCLTEVGKVAMGANTGLSGYELSLFFTIFVFLQFWNMFNARAFETGRSAFHFKGCGGFGLIALVILLGQVLIVSVGGDFFNVEPLKFIDWVIIIGGTSLVLWIGEFIRLFKK